MGDFFVTQLKEDSCELRTSKGYHIARMYYDIKEYELAKRYICTFLSVRETVPQAHKLYGHILSALGKKEEALESYRRSYDLDNSQNDLVLKICELCTQTAIDPERARFWLEKAEHLFPNNETVFKLKEIIVEIKYDGDAKQLEDLLTAEMVKRPFDVGLRIKLLRLLLKTGRFEEAYDIAVAIEQKVAFFTSLEWYETLMDIYDVYKNEKGCRGNTDFYMQYLFAISRVVYLRLGCREPSASADMLYAFDQMLQEAVAVEKQTSEWNAFLEEMQGQIFFLAGTLLLKRAQKGQYTWQEVSPLAGVCYMISETYKTQNPESPLFISISKTDRAKMFDKMQKMGNFRRSQGGHILKEMSKRFDNWEEKSRVQFCSAQGQDKLYDMLYKLRGQRAKKDTSFLRQSKNFGDTTLGVPLHAQLVQFDKGASQLHPDNLSDLIWIALYWYTGSTDACQPSYGFQIFQNLPYSVRTLDSGSPESLCLLDVESFLYAAVRCAACRHQDRHKLRQSDRHEPWLAPSCLCSSLCSHEQAEWWLAAYKFTTNMVTESFSMTRHVLMRGLETVRLVGSHGMSTQMIVNLARSFDKKANNLKTLESDGQVVADHLEEVEERAAFYWRNVLDQLDRLKRNRVLPVPKKRLFAVDSDREFDTNVPEDLKAMESLKAEARFSIGVVAMNNKEFEEAIKAFKSLSNPWASFYTAKIYKMLAKDEETKGTKEAREQSTVLLKQALDSLYHTMDLLRDNKDHELNKYLVEEVDSLQSEIERRNTDDSPDSEYYTPPNSQDEEELETSIQTQASPTLPTVSPRLVNLHPSRNRSWSSHLQPSPERLDAQLRSLSFSQDTLLKMVLERNEDLVNINKEMVQQLRSSHEMMHHLKNELLEVCHHNALLGSNFMPPTPSGQSSYMSGSPYRPQYPYRPQQYPYGPQPGWGSPYGGPMQGPGNFVPPFRAPLTPQSNIRHSFGAYPGKPEDELGHHGNEEDLHNMDGEYYNVALDDESQYYTPEGSCMQQDWPFSNIASMEGGSATTYSPHNRSQMQQPQQQQQQQQNGFIAAHLRGQALQFSGQGSSIPASMPGPGFFSVPQTSAPAVLAGPQPMTVMSGVVGSQPVQSPYAGIPVSSSMTPQTVTSGSSSSSLQQYLQTPQGTPASGQVTPVFGLQPAQKPFALGNLSEPSVAQGSPAFTHHAANVSESAAAATAQQVKSPTSGVQDLSISAGSQKSSNAATESTALFDERAKHTSKIGISRWGRLRVVPSGDGGYIVAMKSDEGEVIFEHDLASVKIPTGFVPQPVCLKVTLPDRKTEETINLTFEDVAHASKLRDLYKQLLEKSKVSALKESSPAATVPSAKPVLPTPPPKSVINKETPPLSAFGGKPVSTSTPIGKDSMFGGFTFTSTPIVKPSLEPTSETKTSPGFKLKESSLNVTSPSAGAQAKPFSGFSFPVAKPSTVTTLTGSAAQGDKGSLTKGGFSIGQNTSATTATDGQQMTFGFKGFELAGQQPFQTGSPAPAPSHEEEKVEEYEPSVDFKPLIELPELVEVKTGEEDEKKLFGERSRLFRFDAETGQWKERGIGEIKILESTDGKRFRILMRREQVLKICANHNISVDMKLIPMPSSDRAWCWTAMDFADESMKTEQFAVKFKTKDIAANFKEIFESCQKDLADIPTGSDAAVVHEEKAASTDAPQKDKDQQSFADKFKPKPGSWECSGCYCRNDADVLKCPACQTLKPGTKPEDINSKGGSSIGGDFTFGSGSVGGPSGGFSFTTEKPQSIETIVTTGIKDKDQQSFADKFKPKPGSWECTGCYCRNEADVLKCPACQTLKPGVKQDEVQAQTGKISTGGGFQFGTAGGFTFGAKTTQPKESKAVPLAEGKEISFADKFKPKPGSWECTGCYCRNDANVLQCPACQTLKPGIKKEDIEPKSQSQAEGISGGGGFKFGSAGGFTFGKAQSKDQPTDSLFKVNKPEGTTADSKGPPSSGGFKFGVQAKSAEMKSEPSPKGSTLAALLIADEEPSPTSDRFSFAPAAKTGGFNFGGAAKSGGFQFNLGKVTTPTKDQENVSSDGKTSLQFSFSPTSKDKSSIPPSPKSPVVDEHGLYINKEGEDSHIYFEPVVPLPDKIEVKTGEEDESVLFEHRAKLYRFDSGEWKERGLGNVKILENRLTKKIRILMRREQVLKLCLNHMITSDLQLNQMPRSDGKAWIWYTQDFSDDEPKIEQFTIRFKTAEIAESFKAAFDDARSKMSEGPMQTASRQLFASEGVEDPVVETSQQVTGDKGNKIYSAQLDSAGVEEPMVPASQQVTGDKGNKIYSAQLDSAGVEEPVVPASQQVTGDKGNKIYSAQLDSAGVEEPVVPASQQVTGDKGNKIYSAQLDSAGVEEPVVPASQQVTGDKGNKIYSTQLDSAGVEEPVVPASQQVTGDKGNKIYSAQLDSAGVEEPMVPASQQVTGDKGNKIYSAQLDSADAHK
ncbi:ranBP2-like and GRIP domain-containing protein 4 isoform X2 [Gigantopelta aegis]|uniref:ranBP2-like and GRIP domain-containing protein 4 isoform X2 n=1 Tax=Gigantopelta aegis TaxID=1735272 RepID=UPI001B88892C|nr:ranBP2-like and GRIP domain-containing protein 4 isoform X2 [Gigantopelta aegis]